MASNNSINNTLQTPFTLGATSVTSTGTQLNYLSGLTSAPINKIVTQVLTSTSGTYTPTAGMEYIKVQLVAGGGSAGGVAATSNTVSGSSGGGGGGYAERIFTAAQVGANAAYLVGAGGAAPTAGNNPGNAGDPTSLALTGAGTITISATGGGAGAGTAAATAIAAAGGAGGTGTNGDLNLPGENGGYTVGNADTAAVSFVMSGKGGDSQLGKGGATVTSVATVNIAGQAGANYGAGGGGAVSFASGATGSGGAGAQGVIYITEYLSA